MFFTSDIEEFVYETSLPEFFNLIPFHIRSHARGLGGAGQGAGSGCEDAGLLSAASVGLQNIRGLT